MSSGFLKDGTLRNSIGFGSSISIAPKLSISAKYSYAEIKGRLESGGSDYNFIANHQQFRVSFQYSLSKHIRVYAGPTFNFLATNYRLLEPTRPSGMLFAHTPFMGQSGNSHGQPTQFAANAVYSQDYRKMESWIGFEAGLAYSIKFFTRP